MIAERIRMACQGAICGTTLGSTRRPGVMNPGVQFYQPVPQRMAVCAAMESWLVSATFAASAGPMHRFPAFRADLWRADTVMGRFKAANQAISLTGPLSGAWQNPLADDGSALLRTAVWGLLYPCDAHAAAAWAIIDASDDHRGETVLASAVIAAQVSRLAGSGNWSLTAFLEEFPESSAIRNYLLELSRRWHLLTPAELFEQVIVAFPGGSHSSGAVVCLAAACLSLVPVGAPALRMASQFGTDSVALCGLVGLFSALSNPEFLIEWLQPIGDAYVSSQLSASFDPPETITGFIEAIGAASAGPALVASDASLPQPVEAIPAEQRKIHFAIPGPSMAQVHPDLVIELEHLDLTNRAIRGNVSAKISFTNATSNAMDVAPQINSLGPWRVHWRPTSFRITPGSTHVVPILLVPHDEDGAGELLIQCDAVAARFPIPKLQTWFVCGPFSAHGGPGEVPSNMQFDPTATYLGRSNVTQRWRAQRYLGRLIEIEPEFGSGEGVIFLARKFEGLTGRYRLIFDGSPGGVASVDGRELLNYTDTHVPTYQGIAPYIADFTCTDGCTVMIMALRGKTESPPTLVLIVDEDGLPVDETD